MVGHDFWQPKGIQSPAKSNIGMGPSTGCVSDPPPSLQWAFSKPRGDRFGRECAEGDSYHIYVERMCQRMQMECLPWQESEERINSKLIFWCEMVSIWHKTDRCKLWQPQGSHFTAKTVIGTPHQTKSAFDLLRNRRGPRPNRWSANLGRNVENEWICILFFFWHEFVCKYHYTDGCNFWQPQGSRFTAKSRIGTPPQTQRAFEPQSNRRGPSRHDRWSAHRGRNVQKEYISIFFGLNWSPNTIKQLDGTFGSRGGAVLQQNSESAHLPEMKVSLTRYQLSVGLDPINGVHTLAGMSKKNIFPLFLVWIRVQIA